MQGGIMASPSSSGFPQPLNTPFFQSPALTLINIYTCRHLRPDLPLPPAPTGSYSGLLEYAKTAPDLNFDRQVPLWGCPCLLHCTVRSLPRAPVHHTHRVRRLWMEWWTYGVCGVGVWGGRNGGRAHHWTVRVHPPPPTPTLFTIHRLNNTFPHPPQNTGLRITPRRPWRRGRDGCEGCTGVLSATAAVRPGAPGAPGGQGSERLTPGQHSRPSRATQPATSKL